MPDLYLGLPRSGDHDLAVGWRTEVALQVAGQESQPSAEHAPVVVRAPSHTTALEAPRHEELALPLNQATANRPVAVPHQRPPAPLPTGA